MPPFGNGLRQLLQIGGVQEVEEREGGWGYITTPPAADTSVLGLTGLVLGRGGGGDDDDDVNNVVVLSQNPDVGSNERGR